MNQEDFQQKQRLIYTDLAGAVLASIPEDWYEAELTLGPSSVIDGAETMSHELSNPQLSTGLVSVPPDETVYAHTRRLELLFRESGAVWMKAVFRVTWDDPTSQWRFVMDYEYSN